MSELNTNKILMKEIIPFSTYQTLTCRTRNDKHQESIIMTFITEEEERKIDKGIPLNIVRNHHIDSKNPGFGAIRFPIDEDNILAYGTIDFSGKDINDFETISNFNWLDSLIIRGVDVPAFFNYNKGTIMSKNGRIPYTETFYPEIYAQYKHMLIGKPERTLIFKYVK